MMLTCELHGLFFPLQPFFNIKTHTISLRKCLVTGSHLVMCSRQIIEPAADVMLMCCCIFKEVLIRVNVETSMLV